MSSPFVEYYAIIERHGFDKANDKTAHDEMVALKKSLANHPDLGNFPKSFDELNKNIDVAITNLSRRINNV